MKTDCEHYRLMIADSLTQRLDQAEASQFKAHLDHCAECRAKTQAFAHTAALLKRLPESSTRRSALWGRIEHSVAQAQTRASDSWRPLTSAAALLLLALLIYFVGATASLPLVRHELAAKRTFSTSPTPRREPKNNTRVAVKTQPNDELIPAPPQSVEVEPRRAEHLVELHPQPAVEHIIVLPLQPVDQATQPQQPVKAALRAAREVWDDALGLAILQKTGSLAVFDSRHRAWRTLVSGERVPYGAKLRTGPAGRAELAFGESRIQIDELSTLVVEQEAQGARVANLSKGRLRVDLLRSNKPFRICSAGGSVELTGTIVEVDTPDVNIAFVRVVEGHVSVSSKLSGHSQPVKLGARQGEEALVGFTPSEQSLRLLPENIRRRAEALAQKAGMALPSVESSPWTEALTGPRPNSAAIGQLIVNDDKGREAQPLRIQCMDVHTFIRGPEALTRIDQTFFNDTHGTLEGTYYFPLPPGAAISRYAMYVDAATLIEGEVVERGHAREIYESILRQKRDPALLEWMEGNLFKTRIFPILAKSPKRVILEYTELLPAFYDTRRYVLPLVSELSQKTPIEKLSVKVELATGDGSAFSEVFSPSYFGQTQVEGHGNSTAKAWLELRNLKPTSDFVLSFSSPRPSELYSSMYSENLEQPYVLLGFQPRIDETSDSPPPLPKRDVLFVLETTGARTPDDLDAQARVLQAMLASLSAEDDRVAVAGADVALSPGVASLLLPRSAELLAAVEILSRRAPMGALDFTSVLRQAAEFFEQHSAANRQRLIVFVGSGIPSLGTVDAGAVSKSGAGELARVKARFVGIGIGRAVETLGLSELARGTGGFYLPLRTDEGLEECAFLLGLSLQTPLIESPEIRCAGSCELYPQRLPSLAPGYEVFAHARLNTAAAAEVRIAGQFNAEAFERKFQLSAPADLAADPAVGRFWARAKLDQLLTLAPDESRRRVVDLAQAWTLMSPFTSFLVLESNEEYARYGLDRAKRRRVWGEGLPPLPHDPRHLARRIAQDAQAQAEHDGAFTLRSSDGKFDRESYRENLVLNEERSGRMKLPTAWVKFAPMQRPATWWSERLQSSRLDRRVEFERVLEDRVQDYTPYMRSPDRLFPNGGGPGFGLRTLSEAEQLRREVEELRRSLGQARSTPVPVERTHESRYGPNARVSTDTGTTQYSLTHGWNVRNDFAIPETMYNSFSGNWGLFEGGSLPTSDNATIAVQLSAEQIEQLLSVPSKTPADSSGRVELLSKLAQLSAGVKAYRVLLDGMAEFKNQGPEAEQLAGQFLLRLRYESDPRLLEVLSLTLHSQLRSRILARRAALEPDTRKRCGLWELAYRVEKSPALLEPLCAALAAAGKSKQVITTLEDALRSGHSEAWMWAVLTAAYRATGDNAGALRALTQGVAQRPREGEVRRQLALLFEKANDGAQAMREMRLACELAPGDLSIWRDLLALTQRQADAATREWALLKMFEFKWERGSEAGRTEAISGLKALIDEYKKADKPKAQLLERKLRLAEAFDLSVTLSWENHEADVDLHVYEPNAHVCYSSRTSPQGGRLDQDVLKGGPAETYTLKRAAPGEYRIAVKLFWTNTESTHATLKLTFHRGAGEPEEQSKTFNLALKKAGEEQEVMKFALP